MESTFCERYEMYDIADHDKFWQSIEIVMLQAASSRSRAFDRFHCRLVRSLFFTLTSRVERLQRVNLPISATDNLLPPSTFDEPSAAWLGHVQSNESNIFRFSSAWQEIIWDVLEMGLYACRMVKSLIMTEMRERFRIFFKLLKLAML